jgi:oligopeptide/dipeptide ABC transporter ATP-binding protein
MVAQVVELDNLVKTFQSPHSDHVVWAVNDVSLSVASGEVLGLVGESGSGKTTVGRCVLRLIEPTGGDIRFEGTSISRLPQKDLRRLRQRMQIVFQDPYQSLDPLMRCRDIIGEPVRLWRQARGSALARRVAEVADLVGLAERDLARYPHELSGGQQQRVGIGRALACEPVFLVLDEPTSALDPTARAEIIDLLMRLKVELGLSYLFISHDLTVVKHISDRIAVMYLGRLVEVGPTETIFERPRHPYTRALMSAALFPDPTVKANPISLAGEIPSPVDLPPGCFLHGRCPIGLPSCTESFPPLVQIDPDHTVYCFRWRDDFEQAVEERVSGQAEPAYE